MYNSYSNTANASTQKTPSDCYLVGSGVEEVNEISREINEGVLTQQVQVVRLLTVVPVRMLERD